MFGGVVDKDTTKELWVYNLTTSTWMMKNHNTTPPIAVASHTAHIINGIMYIIFGYSPIYGYKNRIQEYKIGMLYPLVIEVLNIKEVVDTVTPPLFFFYKTTPSAMQKVTL
jgi:hypothetical protein